MWFVIGIEMLTFGLFFIVFAIARSREAELFRAGQAGLNLHAGALNTALLLTGSWCVARGVHALRDGRAQASARWTWAGAACGAGFLVSKWAEYLVKLGEGKDLSSDTFHMLYYLLTGFHFLHVAAAVLALAVVAWLTRRRRWGTGHTHAPETVAAFWHMVDLLWVVLFPLVYVLR